MHTPPPNTLYIEIVEMSQTICVMEEFANVHGCGCFDVNKFEENIKWKDTEIEYGAKSLNIFEVDRALEHFFKRFMSITLIHFKSRESHSDHQR
jgi:hypothetical protein